MDYTTLEDVIQDRLFPEIDTGLRAGRHISLEGDIEAYEFISQAFELLNDFYARYGCRLVCGPESYFYLLSEGELLSQRRLDTNEMLVGQGLAMIRMDPLYIDKGFSIADEAFFAHLENHLGAEKLAALLLPQNARHRDREIEAAKIRDAIVKALNRLQKLGFVRRFIEGGIRYSQARPAIMRFAAPFREKNVEAGLAWLHKQYEVSLSAPGDDTNSESETEFQDE